MPKQLPILKILTALSFLSILVCNDKFSLPMVLPLLLMLPAIATGYVLGTLYAVAALFAAIQLLVSGINKSWSMKNGWWSLLSIALIYIPFFTTIGALFENGTLLNYISYALFVFLSLLTIVVQLRFLNGIGISTNIPVAK